MVGKDEEKQNERSGLISRGFSINLRSYKKCIHCKKKWTYYPLLFGYSS